jgi:C4-dicarboxylate-specific signal transduction histidine kinase
LGDGAPRILVVDDDPDYSFLVVEALTGDGRFVADVTATGQDARSADYARYKGIILDYRLPDAMGTELLREIVEECDTPVVMLTGENVVDTAVESIKAGAFSYLVKTGENLDVLPEIMAQAVAEAELRREHKRMADQMRRAEDLAGLGTLSSGLCHEMNNPLAAITGYVDLYRQGIETDAHRCMDTIWQAACRLRDVVRSLAAFADSEATPTGRMDLVATVLVLLEEMGPKIATQGVRAATQLPSQPVEVLGNWPSLNEVLRQLIRNACQAMESSARKELTVRLDRRGSRARLEVADTGPGVPEAIRDRLFDPFFTTRDPGTGMGMGLAISHRIIDRHGGRLLCEGGLSEGAVFAVDLPLASGQPEVPADQGARQGATHD